MVPAMITRVSFVAAAAGEWQVDGIRAIRGATLPEAAAVSRQEEPGGPELTTIPGGAAWVLRGVRSNERYVARDEKRRLATVQEGLGRPASRRAALIPIGKSDAWWELAQDE